MALSFLFESYNVSLLNATCSSNAVKLFLQKLSTKMVNLTKQVTLWAFFTIFSRLMAIFGRFLYYILYKRINRKCIVVKNFSLFFLFLQSIIHLTLFRMGKRDRYGGGGEGRGWRKDPLTDFPSATYLKAGINPQNFLAFSPFVTLLQNFKQCLAPVPNNWTWIKAIPRLFFLHFLT